LVDIELGDSLLEEALASASIEGATTTLEEVKRVIKGVSKPTKSTMMVTNTIDAINYSKSSRLGKISVYNTWTACVKGVCDNQEVIGNFYRSGMVYVGRHVPQVPEQINSSMNTLYKFLNYNMQKEYMLIRAFIAHFYFVYIHPFCDGNGRVARVLTQKVLFKSGLRHIYKLPLSDIILQHRMLYYNTLASSEKSKNGILNITPFIEFMLQVILTKLQNIQVSQRSKLSGVALDIYNLLVNAQGAEVDVKSCAFLLKISESTARDNLNRLSMQGYLVRLKVGGKYVYKLNKLGG
jgi:Fic family protein